MKLGPYELGDLIGEGGMGRVYRARDTRLQRDVAIKILPDAFAADPARVARFEREAQFLASLSHPNIGAIYGFEEADAGSRRSCALVLELIEGPTLADRIAKGRIPIDDARAIARQIADALEAAHEKGIIHRDLKPSNIKVRPDGTVKVLDFGLAKMQDSTAAGADLSRSPTMMTSSMPGTIVGTAAYMAPEQAKGREPGRVVDVWAFGCVVYEMLAGRPVFSGDTLSEVLAEVLKTDPDWRALPPDTPESIKRLLRRCLERDPKKRLQHIGDARLELDEPASTAAASAPATGRSVWRDRAGWVMAGLIALTAGVLLLRPRTLQAPPAEVRLDITAPGTPDPVSLALSPDGTKIAFSGSGDQGMALWIRSLDSTAARPIAGVSNARLPFWSADGRSIGFFADGKLKRVDLETDTVRSLTSAVNGFGATWNRDDVILFAPLATGPIERLAAIGGNPTPVTRIEPQQQGHRSPFFLPDGRHFLYYALGATPESSGVYVASIDGVPTSRRVLDTDGGAVFGAGYLFFVRRGDLLAQRFDADALALQGTAITVAEHVATNAQSAVAISVSTTGVIAYRSGPATQSTRQLAWFDRAGRLLGTVGEQMNTISNPTLSPDGHSVAFGRTLNGNIDIWIADAVRGTPIRLTSDPKIDNFPIWSPDGSRVVFESYAGGEAGDLYDKAISGGDDQRLLVSTAAAKFPTDASSDGIVLFQTLDPQTGFDIWAFRSAGDRKPFPVIRTNAEERLGQFAPDGRWVVYESNETGRFEVYVQAFPTAGRKIPVSTDGGGQPRWRRDGRELFYVALDNRLMSVPVEISHDSIVPQKPTPLFSTNIVTIFGVNGLQYCVSADGQRFLISSAAGDVSNNTSPIAVILNWRVRH